MLEVLFDDDEFDDAMENMTSKSSLHTMTNRTIPKVASTNRTIR